MSRLMDYDIRPSAPEAEPEPMTLGQRCLAAVILFGLIWAAGALVLHAMTPAGTRLDFPAPPAQGHTTDVTTTLPPHPAKIPSHPGAH